MRREERGAQLNPLQKTERTGNQKKSREQGQAVKQTETQAEHRKHKTQNPEQS
jgi:hypothetical protein